MAQTRLPLIAPLALALASACAFGSLACRGPRPMSSKTTHELSGPTMGARYSVTLAGPLGEAGRQRAAAAIDAELARIDQLMSTWRDDSEISRVNRAPPGEPSPISPETAEVLATAARVTALSGGAFDVTAGALVRVWGFGPDHRMPGAPTDAELDAARAGVGLHRLQVDADARTLTRTHPATSVDLSAIAPGFAADRVAAALVALGHAHVLVDVGGEIKAVGRRPDGSAWRVGVGNASPATTSASEGVAATVALEDLALATSGDALNAYVDAGGVRRSHIIDPRTGQPVAHRLASATVVHRSAAEADALATALMVLGPDDGLALAQREQLAAYFLVRGRDGTLEARETRAFSALRIGRP